MFRFEIKMTEADFYEFNKFHLFNTEQTKKQVRNLRIIFPVMFLVMWLYPLAISDFDLIEFIARGIVFVPAALFFALGTKDFVWRITKRSIAKSVKTGSKLFSTDSVLEFGENGITETTADAKSEHGYTVVEDIYLMDGRVFYIYISALQAYLLPVSAFSSAEQYNAFFGFIESKTGKKITVVNGKR